MGLMILISKGEDKMKIFILPTKIVIETKTHVHEFVKSLEDKLTIIEFRED